MIEVVNKYKHVPTQDDVYIGRGSVLGNPFTGSKDIANTKAQFQVGSREEAIEAYRDYIRDKVRQGDAGVIAALNDIWRKAKKGKVHLVCFCKPKACHGDVIKEMVEEHL